MVVRRCLAQIAAVVVLLPALSARAAAACPPGNLLQRAELTRWLDTEHATALLTDNTVVPEGAGWVSQAVVFVSAAGSLTFDLGALQPIRAVYLQADAADSFGLRLSRDGKAWRTFTITAVEGASGMRSRAVTLEGVEARYVRFGEPKGSGSHAATELALSCEPSAGAAGRVRVLARDPEPEPGLVLTAWERRWLALTGAPWLTEVQASAAKLALAVTTLALLLFGALAKRGAAVTGAGSLAEVPWYRTAAFGATALIAAPTALIAAALAWPHGRGNGVSTAALLAALGAVAMLVVAMRAARAGPFYRTASGATERTTLLRLRRTLLAALAVASFTGYFNWGAYHYPDFIHHHELFHYFTGAKYFQELGYTRLYACAGVAEAEQGFRRRVELRGIRDLRTNRFVDGAASLDDAHEECKERFSAERWTAFKRDVAYFREHVSPDGWRRMLRDHGYNPSPLWTMQGASIIGDRPASRTLIGFGDTMWAGALGLFDPALMAAALGAVLWAFGWEAACVAAIFFGTNPLASFTWTGGTFLRQDWLATTVLGICLLRRGHPAAGGASLAYAALLRIFPAGLFLPVVAKMGMTYWRARRVDRAAVRLLAGAALAVAVLVPLSGWAVGGLDAWPAFFHNTEKQAATPSSNLVGLRTVLSFRRSARASVLADPSKQDAYAPVREARRTAFQALLPVYGILAAVFFFALVRAAARTDGWWRVTALGIAAIPVMTDLSCYYLSLLVLAALADPIALLALTAAMQVILFAVKEDDVAYAYASVAVVSFAAWLVVKHLRTPARSA